LTVQIKMGAALEGRRSHRPDQPESRWGHGHRSPAEDGRHRRQLDGQESGKPKVKYKVGRTNW